MGATKQLAMEQNGQSQLPVVRRKSIYNIGAEFQFLMQEIEANEGEITPELNDKLAINKEELETKAVNYCYLSKQLDVDTAAIDDEIKRLQALKTQKVNLQQELENRVAEAMKLYNVDKIEKNMLKLSFRKSEQLMIASDAKVPKQFAKIKMETVVDKKALKEHIQSGKKVKGISILTKQNLQIK